MQLLKNKVVIIALLILVILSVILSLLFRVNIEGITTRSNPKPPTPDPRITKRVITTKRAIDKPSNVIVTYDNKTSIMNINWTASTSPNVLYLTKVMDYKSGKEVTLPDNDKQRPTTLAPSTTTTAQINYSRNKLNKGKDYMVQVIAFDNTDKTNKSFVGIKYTIP